jgi:hypothetical protein
VRVGGLPARLRVGIIRLGTAIQFYNGQYHLPHNPSLSSGLSLKVYTIILIEESKRFDSQILEQRKTTNVLITI